MTISLDKIKEQVGLGLIRLALAWTVFALCFQVFMFVTHHIKPELATQIGNELTWKFDGTFKNPIIEVWY